MLKYIPLIIVASVLAACDSKPTSTADTICPTNLAYEAGLRLLYSDQLLTSSSKVPTLEEDKPSRYPERGECEFDWTFDADIDDGTGTLIRHAVVIQFHYNEALKEWVSDEKYTIPY